MMSNLANQNSQTNTGLTRRRGEQLVLLRIGREIYGVDIFDVAQVLKDAEIADIEGDFAFLEGTIELRDETVPVIDLKKRLNLSDKAVRGRKIVVLDFEEGRMLGILTDDVIRVVSVEESSYEPLPGITLREGEQSCIVKMAKLDSMIVMIISPGLILNPEERAVLEKFYTERD